MIKKLLALIVILWLIFFTASPAMAAKTYSAEWYDITVAIQPDGSLMVTETIVFRFEGGPFTYVFRDLEFRNLDHIDQLRASMDGQPFEPGSQPGQVEIVSGQPLKVTWHFSPTSDAIHEFILSYRVIGAFQKNADADRLVWRAIPEVHDYTIAHSTITLTYPTGITPISQELSGTYASVEAGSQVNVFTVEQIDTDEPIDVAVSLPPGSLAFPMSSWQNEQVTQNQRTAMGMPFGLGAAGLTFFLGLVGIVLAGQRFRRGHGFSAQNSGSQSVTSLPSAIPPALAGRLTGSGTTFLGTLFDLAQRGALRIEEGPKKWGSRTFEVVRQPANQPLTPHEQVFMDAFFAKARNDRVALSDIASLASNNQFSRTLDEELTAAGWLDAGRIKQRSTFIVASFLTMALGAAVFIAGFVLAGFAQTTAPLAVMGSAVLIGIGGAAAAVGLVALISALLIPTLSDIGVQQAAAWKSFTGYLRNIARGREPYVSPAIFERYLPYAAGFGFATEWAKYFQKQSNLPIPAWFQGLQSGMDDGSFIAIMAAISAADTSASASSGADGGGASGGGSSGAG